MLLTSKARVLASRGGELRLEVERIQPCANCTCGALALRRPVSERNSLSLTCDTRSRPVPDEGEIVELGIAAGSLVVAAFAFFLYPSILMVCGAYIGAAFGGGADSYAGFGALAGLAVGCGTLRLYYSRGAGPLWVLLPSARGVALGGGRKKF